MRDSPTFTSTAPPWLALFVVDVERPPPMGRSQPTVRNLIERRRESLQPYKRMLRARDQESFEQLWELAAYDAPSIKAAGLADVDWGILFAICRQQQEELEELRSRLESLPGQMEG